jgi:hypothetical protein
MTAETINEAVNQCLNHCYVSPNPLAALAEFINQLRANEAWTAEEVDRVETNSRRILHAILSSGDSD